jgi:glycosyltransferase involved in cell wall biosynthesis
MKFLVITNAPILLYDNKNVSYAPYVAEMNIWFKYIEDITVLSPTKHPQKLLTAPFNNQFNSISIPPLAFTNFSNILSSVINVPTILFRMFIACRKADHIHLRCPGNIGLLGCIVQVFFPNKIKTAKYAGNWDPNASQPLSYRLQKWILSNTFLTRNITVLVYGDWKNQTKNIKPFFTATFKNEDRQVPKIRSYSGALKFVYIGSLVEGKRPLLAIKIVENLKNKGYNVRLDLYGDGVLKSDLNNYILKNQLSSFIKLHGNKEKEVIKAVLKEADFLILLSQSEGWPKAIAEAMFFGVVPISTAVSCVPNMLDFGTRGIIVDPDVNSAIETVEGYLKNTERLKLMATEASRWSQCYTLDVFENEIKKLLKV